MSAFIWRSVSTLIALGSIGGFCSGEAGQSEKALATFQRRFLEPMIVTSIQLESERVSRLSKEDTNNLEQAKSVLGEFFRLLEDPKGNPNALMSALYAKQNPGRLGLRRALIADETAVFQVSLLGFKFEPTGKSMKLQFYVVVMSEGEMDIGEGDAILDRSGESWRVSSVSLSHNNRDPDR